MALCGEQLSVSEQARAACFVYERDRQRFVVAHGVMRMLLARYCGVEGHALCFGAGPAGKPSLMSRPAGQAPIRFNLTHCDGRALLAVSAGREVGVDLERLDSDIDPLAIGRRFFFGPEYADIAAAPEAERLARFLRYWVAKEAVLKAEGLGLGLALDRFEVSFDSGRDTASVRSFDAAKLSGDWRLRLPACEPGWFAAVCAAGEDWDVELMT